MSTLDRANCQLNHIAVLFGLDDHVSLLVARVAPGESVIKYKSILNVLKDTYDHSCCLAR
jgi:hypothetical protein